MQERRIAQRNAARSHAGSGNQHWHKNDSHNDRYVFEQKRTDSKVGITIRETDLRDLRNNAGRSRREPVLTFELNGRDYYVIEDHLWETLHDEIDSLEVQVAAADPGEPRLEF